MIKISGALTALLLCSATQATLVEYTTTSLGNDRWQYDYTVTNDNLPFTIQGITIYFDFNDFVNLVADTSGPVGWDLIAIQPDTGLPDDGFYDALALGGAGIAAGQMLDGFSVTFDFFGDNMPGAQPFEIYDVNSFATLDSGSTSVAIVPPPVTMPEPAPMALLALTAWAAALFRRRAKN